MADDDDAVRWLELLYFHCFFISPLLPVINGLHRVYLCFCWAGNRKVGDPQRERRSDEDQNLEILGHSSLHSTI